MNAHQQAEQTEQALAAQAATHRKRGALLDDAGELDDAIEAYEQALEAVPDLETTRALADLLAKRGRPGDAAQAADLYYTVGDLLGSVEGVVLLERALDEAPGHLEALALLESFVPPEEHGSRLKTRWAAFIDASSDRAAVAQRRQMLMRAQAAERGTLGARSGHTVVGYQVPPELSAPRALATHDGARIPPSAATRSSLPPATRSSAPPATRSSLPPAPRAAASQPPRLSKPLLGTSPSTAPVAMRASVSAVASPVPVASTPPAQAVKTFSMPDIEIDEAVELPKRKLAIPSKPWLIGGSVASTAVAAIMVFSMSRAKTTPVAPATAPVLVAAAAPATVAAAPAPVPAAPLPVAPAQPAAAAAVVPAVAPQAPVPTPSEPPPSAAKKARANPQVHAVMKLASVRGGKLSDQQLEDALTKANPKLEHCYAQALKKQPHTEGRLTLGWTVRTNGRATGVHKVSSTIKDPALYRCTAQVITATHFAKPAKRSATVKLPLEYSR